MATSEATGGYRFQVKCGCHSPTCRPGEGWWGDSCSQFVPREGMRWAWTFQTLHSGKPESHRVLTEVTALGNRGCDTEETPPSFPDHTLASLTQSHKSFQQRQLWAGHLEKALEGLKPLLWCLQAYSLGNPKEKEIVEPRKATRTFFGLKYFIYLNHNNQINIKDYNMTVEAQLCANHGFTWIIFSHYTNSARQALSISYRYRSWERERLGEMSKTTEHVWWG